MTRTIEWDHEVIQDREKVHFDAVERFDNSIHKTVKGRKVTVIEIHWRNGEHHAVLSDGRTIPDIFLSYQ